MKRILLFMIMVSAISINGQKIGELAPEKPLEKFPLNSWGIDILVGESGFGLGTFYRYSFTNTTTGFVNFSISESKDEREFEYIDWYGQSYVVGKKNRVFFLPVNFGLQYRMFEKTVTENLRPYINAGVGPTFLITSPYEKEFFNSLGYARMEYAVGGYIGLGANFGLSKSNLVGLNIRYYMAHIFGKGVENLENKYRKNISTFYITLNLGVMY